MSTPSRFRFTLGQLMGVVAVSAVLFAATSFSLTGQYMYLVVFSYLTSLAEAVVLLYNVRLSRWLWFVFAGLAGPLLTGILLNLASATSPSLLAGHLFLTVHLALNIAFSILFVLGLAMTFSDVRRRLASREEDGAARGVRQGPLASEARPLEQEVKDDADDGRPERTGDEQREEHRPRSSDQEDHRVGE